MVAIVTDPILMYMHVYLYDNIIIVHHPELTKIIFLVFNLGSLAENSPIRL